MVEHPEGYKSPLALLHQRITKGYKTMYDESMDHNDTEKLVSAMVPKAMIGDAKPGDEISFKVKSISGDQAELEPCNDDDDNELMSADEMKDGKAAEEMPLDKLESKLPMADR